MFVEGLHGLRATSIYNGRTLWDFPLPNALGTYHREHSIGAAWTGGNYCLGGEDIYLHTGNRCLRLSADSGQLVREYKPPARPDGKPGTWGYIAWEGGTLFGTLADEEYLVRCWSPNWDTGGQSIQSVMLFAMDPDTGKVKWTYQPQRSIRNNAIAISQGRVYLIDRAVAEVDHLRYPIAPLYAEAKRRAAANGTKEADELLRLIPQPPGGRLLALDAETGRTLWKNDEDIFGTQLAVSDKYGVLLMCYQPAHQASLDSELGDRMAALRTQDAVCSRIGRPGGSPRRDGQRASCLSSDAGLEIGLCRNDRPEECRPLGVGGLCPAAVGPVPGSEAQLGGCAGRRTGGSGSMRAARSLLGHADRGRAGQYGAAPVDRNRRSA